MDQVATHYLLADELIRAGKKDEAIEQYQLGFELLLQSNPLNGLSRKLSFASRLAQLFHSDGRTAEASHYYRLLGKKMPKPPSQMQSLRRVVRILQKQELLKDLTKEEMIRLIEATDIDIACADEKLELIDFLHDYYGRTANTLSPRAITDGFLQHTWEFRQETGDVVAEICTLIGSPLLLQIGFRELPCAEDPEGKLILDLAFEEDKIISFEVHGLESIIAFTNRVLKKVGDERQFFSIETRGPWTAFYLLRPGAYKSIFCGKKRALVESSSLREYDRAFDDLEF